MYFDPVCGMKISNENEATDKFEYEGKTYYFCTTLCRITFENEPERFIKIKNDNLFENELERFIEIKK